MQRPTFDVSWPPPLWIRHGYVLALSQLYFLILLFFLLFLINFSLESRGITIEENPLHGAFVQAGVDAGYPRTEDMNGYQQEGFG